MWPLLFALPVFVMVMAYQLGPVRFHSDDRPWLAAAQNGLFDGFLSSDPYGHFRPTFHAWLWLLDLLGVSSAGGIGLASLLLQVLLVALVFGLFRSWVGTRAAAMGAAIVGIHPVRQDHWFWVSAQIDMLCLLFVVATLWLGVRALRSKPSVPTLVALAVTTLAGSLAKESALALPLAIFFLPVFNAGFRRRLLAATCSSVGASIAVIASVVVLSGIGGHTSKLLQNPDFVRLIRFFLRMLLPFDWGLLWYTFQTDARITALWPLVALGLSAAAIVVYAVAAWRTRQTPTTQLSVILATWAATIWAIHEPDWSLGIAAVSLAALLAGILDRASSRSGLILMVALCFLWGPRWWHCLREWRATDVHTAALEESLDDWRTRVPMDQHLVVLATPYKVGEVGQPERVFELDPCVSRIAEISHAHADSPAPSDVEVRDGVISVSTQWPASFGPCSRVIGIQGAVDGVLAKETVLDRTCDDAAQLITLVVDRSRLIVDAAASGESCRGAIPLAWTRNGLVELSEPHDASN
jgi:hypothetical protein